jgi:hypothetical protein
MRFTAILREAGLNLLSGTTRAALCAVVLAAVLALLGGADIVAVGSLEHRAERFRAVGGSTLIYSMPGKIDGRACDNLSVVPGVSAAGAIRQDPSPHIADALPGQDIPTFAISTGFHGFRALGSPAVGAGVLVSTDLAATLGVRTGDTLHIGGGTSSVADVFAYPSDGRLPGYGYAILIPTITREPFDACWVDAWPANEQIASLLPTTLLPGAVSGRAAGVPGPRLTQLNSTLGERFDGESLYSDRPTGYAVVPAAAVAFALGYASIRMRRMELAAALHARVRKADVMMQILVETFGWLLGGVALAVPLYAVMAKLAGTGSVGVLMSLGLRVAAVAAFTLPGAILACALVREKYLFAYFKGR